MWLIIFSLLSIAYLLWRIWTVLPLPWVGKAVVIALGMGAFLLLPIGVIGGFDRYSLGTARIIYAIGTSSIVVMLYMILFFLALDLGRLVRLVPKRWLYNNLWTLLGVVALTALILFYGNRRYHDKQRVELNLTTDKPLMRDYKIVMLSDLHLGYNNTRKDLAEWVDLINAEKPDFILIAGDIIDASTKPLMEEDMAAEFRRLSAPIYACLGNHERFSSAPNTQLFFRKAGIRLLNDDSMPIDRSLIVICHDDRSNPYRKSVVDLMIAASARFDPSGSAYKILLDHQPYDLEHAEHAGIDFQLSGHTHHGQVWPISWVTDAMYECAHGSYQRGKTQYYVSSGLGIWGGKYRIGTQSEYVVATLKRAAK